MTQKPEVRRIASLPKRKAEFIEPMDCSPVSKLPDGSQSLFEIKLAAWLNQVGRAHSRPTPHLHFWGGERLTRIV
jgi:hypothetical protein